MLQWVCVCACVCGKSVLKRIRFPDQHLHSILMPLIFLYFLMFMEKKLILTLSFLLVLLHHKCFLSCTDSFPRCSASPATLWYLTHNTNTYTCRHIQNSLTLSFSLPVPFPLAHTRTHTHMHTRTGTQGFCNLHAPIWERHTSEKEEGWIRLLGITVAWKAHR